MLDIFCIDRTGPVVVDLFNNILNGVMLGVVRLDLRDRSRLL